MPRGGARPGAGRKKGIPSVMNEAARLEAAKRGVTPIEVLLECMRKAYAEGREDDAGKWATAAAPCMHARFAAIAVAQQDQPVRQLIVRWQD